MRSHRITGGGGIQLHVLATGNARGRPIVFIHGQSQCSLAWRRQLVSDLADDFRLVALDLRGHGRSDKPREGYADSTLWADDVQAVLAALELDQAILCGWSYGSLVVFDYIRHHGEAGLGGIVLVGGVTKLGGEEAMAALTPAFLGLVPGLFATDADESVRSLESLLRLACGEELSNEELYLMLGYNASVSPAVRQALLSRSIDNDDLLPRIRKPVLLVQGQADAIVKPSAVERHKTDLPHAQVRMMANSGHAPFWDDAAAFNRHLRAFAESLPKPGARG